MATRADVQMPNGQIHRKVKAAALSAVTLGPALAVVVNYVLALLGQHPPDVVQNAISVVCEGLATLFAAWMARPASNDAPVPVVT